MRPTPDIQGTTLEVFLLYALLGIIFGLISSIFISYLKQKSDVRLKILTEFLDVRRNLTNSLAEIAIFRFSIAIDDDFINLLSAKQADFSRMFYKYYDFLPHNVLMEILCLIACLSDKKNKIYEPVENKISEMEETTYPKFIEKISMTENFRVYSMSVLAHGEENEKRVASLVCQARMVLLSLNHHFNISNLMKWSRHLPKKLYRK